MGRGVRYCPSDYSLKVATITHSALRLWRAWGKAVAEAARIGLGQREPASQVAIDWTATPNCARVHIHPPDRLRKNILMTFFIETYVKFFFILSPFFLLSTFLSMTREFDRKRRRKTAIKVTISVVIICVVLILSGTKIFEMFGITLDSFRIGTGILLFLSAKSLVQDTDAVQAKDPSEDISVVPLAMPVTVGPATTGFLLVMGSEMPDIWQKMTGVCAIIVAIVSVGILLLISDYVEKILKRQGLAILSKITGLILAAIAAEMVMTGILGFIKQSTEIGQLP